MAWTELHEICAEPYRTQSHYREIVNRLETPQGKQEACQDLQDGTLPLHLLLKNDPPLHVVKKLVEAYPEAVFEYDSEWNYLPLHVACRYGCNTEVIEYLIHQNPDALEAWARGDTFLCSPIRITLCLCYGRDVADCQDLLKMLPDSHPHKAADLALIRNYSSPSATA